MLPFFVGSHYPSDSFYENPICRSMPLAESLYTFIADEEDARVCKDISDDSCRVVPGNFIRILASGTLTKLGDELCNAKTVLPWLLGLVQAPTFLISLLVPIRESGSLLPQLVIAGFIRKLAIRKSVWAAGSLIQGICVALMAIVALFLSGWSAGYAIIGLLIVFSLARGLCSVAHKDVIGKTIPKTRRGRLGGISASLAGAVALATGLLFLFGDPDRSSSNLIAGLLIAAAASWIIAAAIFAAIEEFGGATEGGANAIDSAIASFGLLRSDDQFRLFVTVRSLLLCSALSAPLVVQLATSATGSSIQLLGLFLVANSAASIISGPVWGLFSDRSSRNVIIMSAIMTAVIGTFVVLISTVVSSPSLRQFLFPVAFFALGIAHNGVRLGRKTYLIDMASGNRRTDYVAVSNTIIGALLLVVGLIVGVISTLSIDLSIAVLCVAGVAAACLGGRLKDVQGRSI